MHKKNEGQYMTPDRIVSTILDAVGYTGESILDKKIIEPSFGEGAFLLEIIKRIITAGKKAGKSASEISEILAHNIYGIEKDRELYNIAMDRIYNLSASFKLYNIDWSRNLLNCDTLEIYKHYINQMDFVVGNPPYVDPKHMDNTVLSFIKENFYFCKGKTDLSMAFYDIGVQMLNNKGKLDFISPNSLMKNASQSYFRDYVSKNKYISKIYNFKTSKIFPDADTYTCICVLDKDNSRYDSGVEYREYNVYDMVFQTILPFDYFIGCSGNSWNLISLDNEKFSQNMSGSVKIKDIAIVQNGIVTNCNSVYIHKVYLDNGQEYHGKHNDAKSIVYLDAGKDNGGIPIESSILHRCVKESKYNGNMSNLYIIFPYKANLISQMTYDEPGNIIEKEYTCIPEDEMMSDYNYAYNYLVSQYDVLQKRDLKDVKIWYQFGRSQGIKNIGFKKIIFKHIIKGDGTTIIPYVLDEDVVVYSGIYTVPVITELIASDNEHVIDRNQYDDMIQKLCGIFSGNDFAKYMSMAGKDKHGGYIEISAKNIKEYKIR